MRLTKAEKELLKRKYGHDYFKTGKNCEAIDRVDSELKKTKDKIKAKKESKEELKQKNKELNNKFLEGLK